MSYRYSGAAAAERSTMGRERQGGKGREILLNENSGGVKHRTVKIIMLKGTELPLILSDQ